MFTTLIYIVATYNNGPRSGSSNFITILSFIKTVNISKKEPVLKENLHLSRNSFGSENIDLK
jgi:hypothetical protein